MVDMAKGRLEGLEAETAADIVAKRKRRPKGARRPADDRKRLPVPVPKNKSLQEIKDMDPESEEFRHRRGAKRNPRRHTDDTKELSLKELVAREKQKSATTKRAKARKAEAVTAKAMEVTHKQRRTHEGEPVEDEEMLVAEGVLDLDDWDNEELVRGYRRARNGKFPAPPKYIPREVQQEALRRLYRRGERKMQEAYMAIVEGQIELATTAESEKVRLEAQKAIQERLVGKVPDTVRVGVEAPWQDWLADSLIPVGEAITVDLSEDYANEQGATVYALPPATDKEDASG